MDVIILDIQIISVFVCHFHKCVTIYTGINISISYGTDDTIVFRCINTSITTLWLVSFAAARFLLMILTNRKWAFRQGYQCLEHHLLADGNRDIALVGLAGCVSAWPILNKYWMVTSATYNLRDEERWWWIWHANCIMDELPSNICYVIRLSTQFKFVIIMSD